MSKKLLFSTEAYDSIYDGPRPNGSCAIWMIPEYGKPTIPHTLGDWNFFDEQGDIFSSEFLNIQSYPDNFQFGKYEYKYHHELEGRNHLYLIKVQNTAYFNKNKHIGFRYISNHYIDDIKKGKAKIVVMLETEGTSGTADYPDFETLESWRIKANLPEYSVIFVTGNYLASRIAKEKNLKIKMIPFSDFETWNIQHTQDSIIPFEPTDDEFLFLSYNRMMRRSRSMILATYIKYGVFNKGKVSVGEYNYKTNDQYGIDTEYFAELSKLSPRSISDDLNYNLASNINIEDHKKTFVSIVTETLTSSDTLFLSEKTWKPIQLGHPFMILGCPGTLDLLKQRGYKTFSKFWDESYDILDSDVERADIIVKNIETLSKLTLQELKDLREKLEPILEHNLSNFKKELKENFYVNGNVKKLEKILRKLI